MCNYTNQYFKQSDVWKNEMDPYQYEVLNDILEILPTDINSILDVGCGNGLITNRLPAHLKVVGLDMSDEALKSVEREKFVGDVKSLSFKDKSFDLVMANDVIEHLSVEEFADAIMEISRVAGKYIIITVPFTEDLNANMVKCKNCGNYFHVNHHRKNFGLDDLSQLFTSSDFVLKDQILTGDLWNRDPYDISFIKKVLMLERPHMNGLVCAYCGSLVTESERDSHFLMNSVQKLESQSCIEKSEIVDYCLLRTECISIYKRMDSGTSNSNLRNKSISLYDCPKETIPNNEIRFDKPYLYKKEFLPLYSPFPYFIYDALNQEGICLAKNSRMLMGFFCSKTEGVNLQLKLSGNLKGTSSLEIYSYNDDSGYSSICSVEAKEKFEISVNLNEIAFSSYGLLFSIISKGNDIVLTKAVLSGTDIKERRVYLPDNNIKFLKLSSGKDLYLSLRLYRGAPVTAMEWMESPTFWSLFDPIKYNSVPMKELTNKLAQLCVQLVDKHEFISGELLKQKEDILRDLSESGSERDNLLKKVNGLEEDYQNLNNDHHKLLNDYQLLEDKYKNLEEQYMNLEEQYMNTIGERLKRLLKRL